MFKVPEIPKALEEILTVKEEPLIFVSENSVEMGERD